MHKVKRIYFYLLIFFVCILIACADGEAEHKTAAKKPPTTYIGTIDITNPSAVFYSADSVQLKKIKAVTDSGLFESTMHDCFYQMRNARHVLKEHYPRITILEVSKARYLLFKNPRGEECIDLNEKNDPCGLLLYNGRQPARLVDMTNIESELRFYFSK